MAHLQNLLNGTDIVNGPLDSELVTAALQGHTVTTHNESMTLLAVQAGQFAHEIHPDTPLDKPIPVIQLPIGHTSCFSSTDGTRI